VKDDALIAKKIGHGGVYGLIGAGDLKSNFSEHSRNGTHSGPSNAEEVEVFKMSTIEHGIPLRMAQRKDGVERKP
jgi:hypothetical protein